MLICFVKINTGCEHNEDIVYRLPEILTASRGLCLQSHNLEMSQLDRANSQSPVAEI
jgi:hypothetical protein